MQPSFHLLPTRVLSVLVTFAVLSSTWGRDFYVSPSGDDAWSGMLQVPTADGKDGPVCTLRGARDAVRRARKGLPQNEPVRVLFAPGVYPVSEPVVFTPDDSGTEAAPVVYTASQPGSAVVSGARLLTGFRAGDGIWHLALPEVTSGKWFFRSLFVNERRAIRARTPNVGEYFHIASKAPPVVDPKTGQETTRDRTAFIYSPGDIRRWRNFGDVDLIIYDAWATSIVPIARLDETNRVVEFDSEGIWAATTWDTRYYVEHAPDALDAPGEWYLDREQGELLYKPLPGETPETCEVYAPVTEQLIVLKGDRAAGAYVENIRFDGLVFRHTDWTANIAFPGRAGAVSRYEITDRPVGFRGVQGAYQVPGALAFSDTRNCEVRNCEISQVGDYAVELMDGCKGATVRQCHMHHLGAGGVKIGCQLTREDTALAEKNTVDNNFIHYGGRVYREAVGVLILRSSHNSVTHNEISDLTYTGISVGWDWGYGASSAHHNLVENNHIHRIGRGHLSDMGGIYTLGISPGTVIRGNLIHDLHCYKYGSTALYQDQASSEMLLENNVCYNTQTGGYTLHYGRDNVVRNNIFALGIDYQISVGRPEEGHRQLTFERNIVYYRDGKLTGHKWGKAGMSADRNIYWDAGGETPTWGKLSLEDWQKESGQDNHSLVADPGFRDPDAGDFSLTPDSPVLAAGFVPIDISHVGLYGEADWTSLPAKAEILPMEPFPEVRPVSDDYEGTPVGQLPQFFRVHGEIPGAGIRVTDRVAHSGTHSLEFTDSADVKADYNPHMTFDQQRIKEGTLEVSFAMRLEKAAMPTVEWRDWFGGPIRTGPRFSIGTDGKLSANGRELMTVPLEAWVQISMTCTLGRERTGTFSMTIQVPGNPVQTWTDLPCGYPKFSKLNWIGFISGAQSSTRFQIDDFSLRLVQSDQGE